MTAIIDTAPGAPLAKRLANVVRIHLANPWPTLITPWLVSMAIFGFTYAIWRIVLMAASPGGVTGDGFQYAGGNAWILVYMVVVAAQSMNQTFRFALGFSSTRRDYYLGTAALFTGLSAMYAAGITMLAGVESLTDGWGVDGAFFAPAFLVQLPLAHVFYVYFTLLLFMFFLGATVGSVFVRWGGNGVLVFCVALAAVLVAAVWLVTRADAWESVASFFTSNSVPAIFSWLLPLSAAALFVGFVLMRRATPRS